MINPELIAPCGMNCHLCSSYLAFVTDTPKVKYKLTHCKGCRPRGKKCAFLVKRCEKLMHKEVEFCYECNEFPCKNLKSLDQHYRKRYNMSMIENLKEIRENGMVSFLENQDSKYKCHSCNLLVSVHSGKCFNCEEINSWKD
nr:DUF3795 domain-containing protein [Bacteroidota bacterium]